MFKNKAGIIEEEVVKFIYNTIYRAMLRAYHLIDDYTNPNQIFMTFFVNVVKELTNVRLSIALGTLYIHQRRYTEATEICENALLTSLEIGDEIREVACYENLATVFHSVFEYVKAKLKEYLEKAVAVGRELRDMRGEATACGNLGLVFQWVGEYVNAKGYLTKALKIQIEIGDRKGGAMSYGYQSVGKYDKTRKHWRSENKLDTKREKGLIVEI